MQIKKSNTNTRQRETKTKIYCPGYLYNTNTIEGFKELNKQQLFDEVCQTIHDNIANESALKNPSLLTPFLLVTYADLKKYKFYYWFAWPALRFENYDVTTSPPVAAVSEDAQLTNEQLNSLRKQHLDLKFPPFFAVTKSNKVLSLEQWQSNNTEVKMFGFVDCSSLAQNPGWPLRNFSVFLSMNGVVNHVKVLSLRADNASSLLFNLKLPSQSNNSLSSFFVGEM